MSDFEEPQSSFEDEKPKNTFDSDLSQSTFADEEPKLKRGELVIHDRTWQEIWKMALTQPSMETYEDILRDRVVTVGRGATWVFIAFIISYVAGSISQLIFGNLYTFGTESDASFTGGFGIIGIICSPVFAGIGVGFWLIFVGIIHLVARYLLGGQGDYNQIVFGIASFQAPISIIAGLANFVPFVGLCVNFLLWLYSLVLAVIATNAVYQFGWLKAIIAYFALPLLLVCCICGCFIFALSSADGGFQDIIDSLVSPTPFGR